MSNSGDVFGDLETARNFQFDEEGYATLAKRPASLYTSTENSDFGNIISIVYHQPQDVYHIVTDDSVFKVDLDSPGTFTEEDSSNPTLGLETDAVAWQARTYVTAQTSLSYLASGTWTNSVGSISLTNDRPHPLCVFENLNQLAIGNANVVTTYNTSHTLQNTLTIPSEYWVTSLRWRNNFLYIGTKHIYGGEAKLFIWNGAGTSAQGGWGCGSSWIFAISEYQSSVAVITLAGQLLRFNGGGFDVLANFPVYTSQSIWQPGSSGGLSMNGKVFNRGIVADGDVLFISIDGSIYSPNVNEYPNKYLANQPSGLWCYDPKVGLYPRSISASVKYDPRGPSGLSDSIISFASSGIGVRAETGDPCVVTNVGSITGITAGYTYYVIRQSETSMKLALTRADAVEGNAITLGGSVGSASISFVDYSKIGDFRDEVQGAVAIINPENTFSYDMFDAFLLWGSGASLNTMSTAANVGSLVFCKAFSSGIADTWQKVYVSADKLNSSQDKVIVKYQEKKRDGLPTMPNTSSNATWTAPNAFTLTSSTSSWNQVEEGDEVTIIEGAGAGYTAHISSISGTSVTLDEDIPGINLADTSILMADGYKKAAVFTNDSPMNDFGYFEAPIGKKSPWIKLKIETRGHEVRIGDAVIINQEHKPAV